MGWFGHHIRWTTQHHSTVVLSLTAKRQTHTITLFVMFMLRIFAHCNGEHTQPQRWVASPVRPEGKGNGQAFLSICPCAVKRAKYICHHPVASSLQFYLTK